MIRDCGGVNAIDPKRRFKTIFSTLFGKINPGLRKEVGGNFTFFSPRVAGLFFMFPFPVFALLSGFFFFGNRAGKDSNSNKF